MNERQASAKYGQPILRYNVANLTIVYGYLYYRTSEGKVLNTTRSKNTSIVKGCCGDRQRYESGH